MNKLKHYRKIKHFTQEELAAASGVTRQTIVRLESGNGNPLLVTMVALSEALELKVGTVFPAVLGGNAKNTKVGGEKVG